MSDVTISLTGPNGETLVPPMPVDQFISRSKAASATVRKKLARPADGDPRPMSERNNTEMFSEDEMGTDAAQTIAAGQLRALIERIERLEEEKKTIADDIKDIYAEAKGNGFDTKAIRTIVRLRKIDQAEREEAETILDLYKSALGMT